MILVTKLKCYHVVTIKNSIFGNILVTWALLGLHYWRLPVEIFFNKFPYGEGLPRPSLGEFCFGSITLHFRPGTPEKIHHGPFNVVVYY